MKRREFITLLGGAAAWPLAARAQQPERMRRIGVSCRWPRAIRNRQPAARRSCRDCRISAGPMAAMCGSIRAGALADADHLRQYAAELVALAPDVILAIGSTDRGALRQATRSVPIVFVLWSRSGRRRVCREPGAARRQRHRLYPFEYSISGKWLELLKEIAPRMTRAAFIRDYASPSGIGQFAALQSVAPSVGVEVNADQRARCRRDRTCRHAHSHTRSNGGLIVTTTSAAIVHRELIIALAARHRLPAIYPYRFYVTGGGLISYGADSIDQYRRAAGYVDRILKGEKPADLPVQAPTKYELVINLKTAKALGLDVPPSLLARADEVIE